jgi:peroxiredoxin
MKMAASILLSFLCIAAFATEQDTRIGTKPEPWDVNDWLNSEPLTLAGLAGKVVLVRWWTAPECPYCRKTAPALNEFYANYHDKGLEVLGFYHHKDRKPYDIETVKKFVKEYEFKFPIANDPKWRTLNRWWLNAEKKKWTSVSFLIDRKGVIRHIHPGGQYEKGDADYEAMKAKIEELLNEK